MKKLGHVSGDELRSFGRGLEQVSSTDGDLNYCSKTCKSLASSALSWQSLYCELS